MRKRTHKQKCETTGCFTRPDPGRTKCNKCRSKAWREKEPIAYVWHMLKKSAKKRKLPFTISLEYFKEFITDSGYMEGRGRLLDSLNIDRKDNLKGYEPGNLEVITKQLNLHKYHHEDDRREDDKRPDSHVFVGDEEEDLPF